MASIENEDNDSSENYNNIVVDVVTSKRKMIGLTDKDERAKKTFEQPKPRKRSKFCTYDDDNDNVIILNLTCPQSDCQMKFDSSEQLHQHQITVHGVLPFPCLVTECSKQFSTVHQLAYHIKAAHFDRTNWTCPQCNDQLSTATYLRRHIYEFHENGRFRCSDCNFETDLRFKLRVHRSSVHSRFRCSLDGCDKAFHRSFHLKRHQMLAHSAATKDVPKDKKSPNPNKQMSKPKVDEVDEGTSSKVRVLGLKCSQNDCETMHKTIDELYQHQESAHSILPFPCLVSGCKKMCKTSNQVGGHIRSAHPNHTDWCCPVCNVQCSNQSLLRNHLNVYHQTGQFGCSHSKCNFEADTRSKVKNHCDRVHIRYVCGSEGCGKVFRRKAARDEHELVAHV